MMLPHARQGPAHPQDSRRHPRDNGTDSCSITCTPLALAPVMDNTKIGFIGLGNVGGKLAGSLARHGIDLTVRDLNADLEAHFLNNGASRALSPRDMAEKVDVIITCLPSPAACADVMERRDGILAGLSPGKVWLEMSTTDSAEVKRLGR